jgi:2-keto-4-pentenoate hydratase
MTNTTKNADVIDAAAAALWQARTDRSPIAPISQTFGIASLQDAYKVSSANVSRHSGAGHRIVGKKVGLTSKAVQQQLGVDQPDFGTLFDDMEYLNGQAIPTARLMQPKIEAEVAFVLAHDLPQKSPSWSEFIHSIGYALPALEIVDSAIADWKISLVDTVADNASCGLYVLGDQPSPLGAVSLGNLGMQMTVNGITASVGTGAACLGHPLRAAYWLAQSLAALGDGLRAGEVILSGALGPMVPVKAGDIVQADLGSLGSVGCRMI